MGGGGGAGPTTTLLGWWCVGERVGEARPERCALRVPVEVVRSPAVLPGCLACVAVAVGCSRPLFAGLLCIDCG
eukprot:COSAG01_NODE_21954_length_874_cov_0.662388_1_plen_74_part_00